MSPRDRLLDALRRVHDGQPWHGPSRTEVLRGVTAREARFRAAPDAHTIWELVLHMRSWTEEVLARARGAVPGEPAAGDWPAMPEPADDAAWRETLRSLDVAHEELWRHVQTMDDASRAQRVANRPDDPPDSGITQRAMIRSLAEHDVYHTGQLAILKRIARSALSSPPQ